jgi:hypothetical protein
MAGISEVPSTTSHTRGVDNDIADVVMYGSVAAHQRSGNPHNAQGYPHQAAGSFGHQEFHWPHLKISSLSFGSKLGTTPEMVWVVKASGGMGLATSMVNAGPGVNRSLFFYVGGCQLSLRLSSHFG